MNKVNIVEFLYITIILIVSQYIIFEYYNDIIFNGYLFMLIISFSLAYYYTNDYNISLFSALSILIIQTCYNYNKINECNINNTLLFGSTLGYLYLLINNYKFISNYLTIMNFSMLSYVIISITEFLVHKYVMHCDKKSLYYNIINKIPYINSSVDEISYAHIEHHLDVGHDMNLKNNECDIGLHMQWNEFMSYTIIIFICLTITSSISKYKITWTTIIILSILITIIWEYIWNKIHPKMHNYIHEYSITEGPYDEGLFNLTFVKDILYENHKIHHTKKGVEKGNYNVILLGCDDWFGYNNKS